MNDPSNPGAHHRADADERRRREAALDKTIEASFPASDPPSTDPNPDTHDAVEPVSPDDPDTDSER
jgi:hypothetical protein